MCLNLRAQALGMALKPVKNREPSQGSFTGCMGKLIHSARKGWAPAGAFCMFKQIGIFTKEEVIKVPSSPGVYFVLCNQEFARLKGKTNILYIGKATNLAKRLTGRRNAMPRFMSLRRHGFKLTFEFITTTTKEQARVLEAQHLRKYELSHLELPPLNHAN